MGVEEDVQRAIDHYLEQVAGGSIDTDFTRSEVAYVELERYDRAIEAINECDSGALDFLGNSEGAFCLTLCDIVLDYRNSALTEEEAVRRLNEAKNQADILLREKGYNPDVEKEEWENTIQLAQQYSSTREETEGDLEISAKEILKRGKQLYSESWDYLSQNAQDLYGQFPNQHVGVLYSSGATPHVEHAESLRDLLDQLEEKHPQTWKYFAIKHLTEEMSHEIERSPR